MTWSVAYGFKFGGIYYIRRDAGHSIFATPMMNDDYAVKCASILFQHFTPNNVKHHLLTIYSNNINNMNEPKTRGYATHTDENMTLYHSDKKGMINTSMWYLGHESQTVVSSAPEFHCNKLKWGRWDPAAKMVLDVLKANAEVKCDKINVCELHHHVNMETFQDIFLDCHIYNPSLFEKQMSTNDVSCILSYEFACKNPSLYQNDTTLAIIDFDDMKLKCYKNIESVMGLYDDCGFATLVDIKPNEYDLKVLMNRR